MPVFNLKTQQESPDYKITAGLERLGQVFRTLLWEKAKEFDLSPVQIQLLIFMQQHHRSLCTVSYLAQEFNLSKPTISDAVKILEKKKLIEKKNNPSDSRSYSTSLTLEGKKITRQLENFADPVAKLVSALNEKDKDTILNSITALITQLLKKEIISVQRTCVNCRFYSKKQQQPFCNLLNLQLMPRDIRLDCPEFEAA